MPIKKKEKIFEFFEENCGREFIHVNSDEKLTTGNIKLRVQYCYFWQERLGRKRGGLLNKINSLSLLIQRKIKLDRTKKWDMKLCYGSQWFSITNAFAEYVIINEKKVKKYFRFSKMSDELFLQTLIVNSEFKNNLYLPDEHEKLDSSVREIDWDRGQPWVFRRDDVEYLLTCKNLFARKFDLNVDKQAVDDLYRSLTLVNLKEMN